MKKRLLAIVAALTLGGLLAGCGNQNPSPGNDAKPLATAPASKTTVKIFTSKIELIDQLNQMKEDYESENPGVTLQINSSLGGDDSETQLKAKFASNEMPDIFNNIGDAQRDVWLEHLEDLSDQPWVQDEVEIAKAPMTKDGKIYGMPLNFEGIGLAYNKEYFQKVGITELPTTFSALKAAVEKLKDAGIQPFITNYDNWFPLGYHMINNPFSKQADPNAFIQGLDDGTQSIPDNAIFNEWVQLFDLVIQNGSPNPMTLDMMTASTELANGKGAMMLTGNFIEPTLEKLGTKYTFGLMPIPINEDVALNDNIVINVPTNWVIYKGSPVKEEAKAFLNWLVTSDTGRHYVTDVFNFVPAFNSIPMDMSKMGTLSRDVVTRVEQEKVLGKHYTKFPPGTAQEFGATMQKYAVSKINAEQMLAEFQATWESKRKK